MRVTIYRRLERLAPAGLRAFGSGDLLARLISDVDSAQDLFIRGIAPPLTAVLGHLETLTMAEVRLDDERRLRHVSIARREAQRLERLVGDLLDTARLEAGGGTLDLQTVSAVPQRGACTCEIKRTAVKADLDFLPS